MSSTALLNAAGEIETESPADVPAVPPTVPATARPPANLIYEFPRQPPFLILLLTSLTSGLYLAVWYDRQVRVLSRLLPRRPVEPFWMPALWCLCGVSAGWVLTEHILGLTLGAMLIGMAISQLAQFVCVLMAFQIRSRLNALLAPGSFGGGHVKPVFSILGTLLGNAIYLQWKINKLRCGTPAGYCRHCSYNLTGLTLPRCPACGTGFDPLERGVCLAM